MGRKRSRLALIGLGFALALLSRETSQWTSLEEGVESIGELGASVVALVDEVTVRAGVRAAWDAAQLDVFATLSTDDGVSEVSVTADGTLPDGPLWNLPMPDAVTTTLTFGQVAPRDAAGR